MKLSIRLGLSEIRSQAVTEELRGILKDLKESRRWLDRRLCTTCRDTGEDDPGAVVESSDPEEGHSCAQPSGPEPSS